MSGVEGVVTEVLRAHPYASDHSGGPGWRCLGDDCTAGGVWDEEYDAHLAELLVQALGLTEQRDRHWRSARQSGELTVRRWVSPWVAVERGEQ